MKVQIIKPKTKSIKPKHPYIGIAKTDLEVDDGDPLLVLFFQSDIGVVLSGTRETDDGLLECGQYYTDFDETNFVPYEGKITLSND